MKSIATMVIAFSASLAIWLLFYELRMPLTPTDTVGIVGIVLAVALFGKWLWSRLRRKPTKKKGGKAAGTSKVGVLLLFSVTAASASADAPREPDRSLEFVVACSPDAPVLVHDSTVVLRAWVPSKQPADLSYSWKPNAGTIRGRSSEVRWDLRGVPSGSYESQLRVNAASGSSGTCSIRVVVMDQERGTEKRESGRKLLAHGEHEAGGYGLYSFLLFGAHPTEDSRERYLTVIQAYLDMIDDLSMLEEYVSHNKLNITYLPVASVAPPKADAAWLLTHYDYPRARVLLDALPGQRRDGVYLVSTLKPLTQARPAAYLLQDLSTVPARPAQLVSYWLREFLNQAAQERFWEPRTAAMLALRLRTTVSVLANGLPDVKKGLDNWISWMH